MDKKHLFWIVPLITIIVSVAWFWIFVFTEEHINIKDIKIKTEMGNYWACMDGCFNMEVLINGQPKYEDAKSEFRHDVCSGICCKQYMLELGCQ